MRFLLLLLIAGCSEAHAVAPKKAKLPLGEQLVREASARPKRAVRPEQLIEALAAKGVTIARHRQVLASPVEASYCEALTTAQGLGLALCEYADADAAANGRAQSKRAFDRLIPGRALDTNANSLLTVTAAGNDEGERQRELARRTFAALQPR
ncbi:MAG TPA: hypothetical protein VFX59_03370 [Polyangiales bacterium]|nr:hypothetical protein [Polyangiales bacterium]